MRTFTRTLLAALLLFPASALSAQTAVDPTGHWEGTIQVQDTMINIEIDLTRNSNGELSGTFSQPVQQVKGLPLSTVATDGRTVRILLKGGPQPTTFQGTVSDDGKSMKGDAAQGGYSIPFTLTRTGDARIAAAPKNAPIGKELEGTWNGALEVGGTQMRLIVKMANQPDGTAAGTIVSPDGSGVEIPIGITQKGSNVTVDVASVGASFVGVLNDAGTEMTGTWTQASNTLPLTLRHATGGKE
jgi:hypothetical protein